MDYDVISKMFIKIIKNDADIVWDLFAQPIAELISSDENQKLSNRMTQDISNALIHAAGTEDVISQFNKVQQFLDGFLTDKEAIVLNVFVDGVLRGRKGYEHITNVLKTETEKRNMTVRFVNSPQLSDLALVSEGNRVKSPVVVEFSLKMESFIFDIFLFKVTFPCLLARALFNEELKTSFASYDWIYKTGTIAFNQQMCSSIDSYLVDYLKESVYSIAA